MKALDHKTGQLLPRFLLFAALLLSMLLWQQQNSPGAAAAGWNVYSGGGCGPTQGYSTLAWDGYFAASSGESYSTLWRWNGGGWDVASQAHQSAGGSSNNATAYTYTPGGGLFYSSGSHGATFFSGWQYSSSSNFTC